ncbi:MAG: protease HtpX [Nitrospiraceae bacterium]|nr:MAG: protease HtpX [Nitrospiraceae bacterium]
MKKLKGIGLLLVANLLISITLYIVFQVLANVVLPAFGIDIRGSVNESMLLYACVLGFGGAFISLAFSKQFARAMLDCYQVTEPKTRQEEVVFQTVRELAQRLHVQMPEVWIFDAPDPNAFATGPTKNNAMVAVSTGLLENLNEEEVRSALAHEMGHVWNGDMFTTTVLAGLMNTFVYFIAMWVRRMFEERDQAGMGIIASIVLQIVLSILAMIVINWFSRRREFEADRFAGKAYGPAPMISALESIQRYVEAAQVEYSTQDALATMKISGSTGGWMNLFATHPPIEERIAALKRLA